MEESKERRRNHQGERMGARHSINLGGDSDNENSKNIIHLGLRWTLIDYFTHNNQSKTGGPGGGE